LTNTPDFAKVASSGSYNDLTDTPDLAAVATSGNYNNLDYKPSYVCSNASEISAAISSIKGYGGRIFLLNGTYDFTSSDPEIAYDNIVIEGASAGAVIKLGASSRVHITGNNVSLKNLTILREEESTKAAVSLDSDGTHTSERFEMNGVTMDCAKTTAQLVSVSSPTVQYTKFLDCILISGGTAFIATEGSQTILGIVNGCMSAGSLTVPKTMTGAVVDITQAMTASEE
jgi:hypothetical protein